MGNVKYKELDDLPGQGPPVSCRDRPKAGISQILNALLLFLQKPSTSHPQTQERSPPSYSTSLNSPNSRKSRKRK
jgi:hypothetical protein